MRRVKVVPSSEAKIVKDPIGDKIPLDAGIAKMVSVNDIGDKVVPVDYLGDKALDAMIASNERVSSIYRQVAEQIREAGTSPAVDYEVLHGTIEDVRKTDPHPERLDRIEAAIDALKTTVDARGEALADIGEALTEIGDATAVEVSRLERALRTSETKAKRSFWLGIALAIPTGVVSSILWWLISGRS